MGNIVRMTTPCPPVPCPPPGPPPGPPPPGPLPPGMTWFWDGCQWICVLCPPPTPPPPAPPFPGAQWMWDGTQWVCTPLPPCPLPLPPCPPPVPPSCFSAIAKAQACFDQSQALTALVTDVVTQIFKDNPSIIPPPPPSAGTGPIIGVTDGSNAKPGEVGEYLKNVVTGTAGIGGTPGTALQTTFAAITVPPGDWNVASWFSLSALAAGAYITQVALDLKQDSTIITQFNFLATWGSATNAGLLAGVFPTPQVRVSTAVPILLVGEVGLFGTFAAGTVASYTATTAARRMR